MFEKASRLKLRFDSPKGSISVEDLWDLPLTVRNGGASLDNIARDLSRKTKETETESFVVKAPKTDEILALKFEIVKHIISVLVAEKEAKEAAQTRKEQKDRLNSLIARKQDEQLEGSTLEQLTAMRDAL